MNVEWVNSSKGQILILVAFLGLAVAGILWQRSRRQPVILPSVKSAVASLPKTFTREGARFVPPSPPPAHASSASKQTPSTQSPKPVAPPVLPLSLLAASPAPTVNKRTAPFGRLIPCETVIALESNRLATPIIGLVTEDIWHDGRLIVPKGAEVHGRIRLDPARERLAAENDWIIVAAGSSEGARELRVSALALERDLDPMTGAFGEHDGSAGLRGEVLRTGDQRELKLFAATFLASATTALQDTRVTAGLLGDASVPAATARNATLAGTGAILREYAQQIREAIARDGFYVRVPAGKPFYLYVTQDLGSGRPTATGFTKHEN